MKRKKTYYSNNHQFIQSIVPALILGFITFVLGSFILKVIDKLT